MSGVVPGTYGNENQVPSFTVDARGRLVWAANIDISPTLNVEIGNNRKTLNLKTDSLKFLDSSSIKFEQNDEGIIANLESSILSKSFLQQHGALIKNDLGIITEDIKTLSLTSFGKVKSESVESNSISISEIFSSNGDFIEGKFKQFSLTTSGAQSQGPFGASFTGISLKKSRGNSSEIKDIELQDNLQSLNFEGYLNGKYNSFGGISCKVLPHNNQMAGLTYLYSLDQNFDLQVAGIIGKVFLAPIFCSTGMTEDDKSNPDIPTGTIAYNQTLDKFQGYTKNSGWVDLH